MGASKTMDIDIRLMMDILVYADGKSDLLAISEKLNHPLWRIVDIVQVLLKEGLLAKK